MMTKYVFVVLKLLDIPGVMPAAEILKGRLLGSFIDVDSGEIKVVTGNTINTTDPEMLNKGQIPMLAGDNANDFLSKFGMVLVHDMNAQADVIMTKAQYAKALKKMEKPFLKKETEKKLLQGRIGQTMAGSSMKKTSMLRERFHAAASLDIDTNLFKNIAKALAIVQDEVVIIWDDSGIFTMNYDSSHVFAQKLVLSKSLCSTFIPLKSPIMFKINTFDLNKIVKRFKGMSSKNRAPRRSGKLGEKVKQTKARGARGELIAQEIRFSIDEQARKIAIEPIRESHIGKTIITLSTKPITASERDDKEKEMFDFDHFISDQGKNAQAKLTFSIDIKKDIKAYLKPKEEEIIFIEFMPETKKVNIYPVIDKKTDRTQLRMQLTPDELDFKIRNPVGNVYRTGFFVSAFDNLVFDVLGKQKASITMLISNEKPLIFKTETIDGFSSMTYVLAERVIEKEEEEES